MSSLSHPEQKTFDANAFAAHTLSSPQNLAAVLDHTLLKADATRNQVLQLCHEAASHRFACAINRPAEYLPRVSPPRLCPTTTTMMCSG